MKYGQYFQQSESVSFLMTFCSRNNFKPTFIQDDFVWDLLAYDLTNLFNYLENKTPEIVGDWFAVRIVCNEARSCEPSLKVNKVGLEDCMLDVLFLYIWSMAKRLTSISVGIQMVVKLNFKLWGST